MKHELQWRGLCLAAYYAQPDARGAPDRRHTFFIRPYVTHQYLGGRDGDARTATAWALRCCLPCSAASRHKVGYRIIR